MNNILLNSALTLDTFGEVIDMVRPLFLCKLTTALALVTIAFFFFGRKLFSVSNAQDALLAIVAPNQHGYTKMSDELLVPEFGLLRSYGKIMRMIYPNAHPAEFEEKVAVATMNHQLKYGCIVWSMFNKMEEVGHNTTLITQRSQSGLPLGNTPRTTEESEYTAEPVIIFETLLEEKAPVSFMQPVPEFGMMVITEPEDYVSYMISGYRIVPNVIFAYSAMTTPLVIQDEEQAIMSKLAQQHTLAMLVTARLQEDYDLALVNRGIEDMSGVYVQSTMPHIEKSRSAVTHSVPTMYLKGEKPPVRGSPKKNLKNITARCAHAGLF